jgi:diguanylate cyclase (GGDEF)-like protein/PAS domain S-box-containing protein
MRLRTGLRPPGALEGTKGLERGHTGAHHLPDLRLARASNYVLRLEELISQVSRRCINLPPEDLEEGLEESMALLGAFAQADRAYVFQLHGDPEHLLMRHTHEWCAHGIAARMGSMNELPMDSMPWFAKRLRAGDIVYVKDVPSLPDAAAAERVLLGSYGVKTLLTIPISNYSGLYGFLGFHAVRTRRLWSKDVIGLMQLVAECFANAMERREAKRALVRSQDRYEQVMANAHDAMWEWDVLTDRMSYSPNFLRILGVSADELGERPMDWRGHLHPDERERMGTAIASALRGEITGTLELEHRVRVGDGDYHWYTSRIRPIHDDQGALVRVVGNLLDVTEAHEITLALDQERAQADLTLQSLDDGVITITHDGRIRSMNPAAEALTGWALEDALGRAIDEVLKLVREDNQQPITGELERCLRDQRVVRLRDPAALSSQDGSLFALELTATPLHQVGGEPFGAVIAFRDVTVTRRLTRRLAYQASHDLLTGLVNRREFEVRLRRALHSAQHRSLHHVLCFFDLDQFKVINDACGHTAGDVLLGQLGHMLREEVSETDTVGRLGGDEFSILLEDCDDFRGRQVAERVHKIVEEFAFEWQDHSYRLGVSIGVVPVDGSINSVSELLSVADSACFAAKEMGSNNIYQYTEGDTELAERRQQMRWVTRLNSALEQTRFRLFQQPILRLDGADGPVFREVLLRMEDDDGELVRPQQFIGAAERYKVMGRIDRWVVSSVLRWMQEQETEGWYSVNLSGQSLGDPKFLDFLARSLDRNRSICERLCFEVTETAAIARLNVVGDFIQELKGRGCRFALDDFGSGMSSFGYLKRLPVDFLKIDGSFVQNMAREPLDAQMVRSIHDIGHITGNLTIAEYVEDEATVEALRAIGVDYAQGYHLGRPEPLGA